MGFATLERDPRPAIRRRTTLLKRLIMTLVHQTLRAYWFFRRPVTKGARAIAITPGGRIILIRHSYIPGWHLPGGGCRAGEEARAAVLRELREEIGLISHGGVEFLAEYAHVIDFKDDRVSLFVATDVVYAAGRSLEVDEVMEFPMDDLPPGVSAPTRRRLAEFRGTAPISREW